MPVNARRLIRKMRGGAQAHLLECDDNRFYVVKFRNNPQHRRILVNEWISSVFLRYLGISSPDTGIVNLSAEFLGSNADIYMQLGSKRLAPESGWHFGSCFPGNPEKLSTYDFIPDVLLEKVVNMADFLGVLVFDKWTGNADARQSIFFRARIREWAPQYETHPNKLGFVAQMMDHGYTFDGPHWSFSDSPLQGLYFRPMVYQKVTGLQNFQPWLDQVMNFPEEVVDDAIKQIPPEWLDGDETVLEGLLSRLMGRRRRIPELLKDCCTGRTNPFPNWK